MIDIVDTQVHLARGKIAGTLEAMDALGIRSVIVDEFWGLWDSPEPTHIKPGHALPNGAWRTAWPTAAEASALHPDRFAFLVRIDRHDPDLESVMRVVATTPGARAFRLQPVWTMAEIAALADGAYDPLLVIAGKLGLPVCWFVPGYVELVEPYLRRHPEVRFVIDHCGMGFAGIPPDRPAEETERVCSPSYLDTVLALARHPNATLKWSHAERIFGAGPYPFVELRFFLRRLIRSFGADRIMWASDKTVMFGRSWGDLLYSVRDDPSLSDTEKAWILGGTARRVFNWQVPPPPPVGPNIIR